MVSSLAKQVLEFIICLQVLELKRSPQLYMSEKFPNQPHYLTASSKMPNGRFKKLDKYKFRAREVRQNRIFHTNFVQNRSEKIFLT